MIALTLVAEVAGRRVAFDAASVEAVVDLGTVMPTPLAPAHLVGLVALRSRVASVIDTAAALGLDARCEGTRALVVLVDGHRYALKVDRIEDVSAPLSVDARVEAGAGTGWRAAAIGTVDTAGGFALLLDPARIVAGPAPQRLTA